MKKTTCSRGHARTPENLYWNGRSHHCRLCSHINEPIARRRYKRRDPWGYYLTQLRKNAKRRGLEFSITKADLEPLPEFCPVLGMRLNYFGGENGPIPDAASVDRHDSRIGYIPGNVTVMSARANMLKSNASAEELQMLTEYMFRLPNPQ